MDRRTFFSGLATGAAAMLGLTKTARATAAPAESATGGVEPFVGQIQTFGFNFAPRGWATCDGQLLQISSNSALFSLLGTTYGGDGRVTFGLPDLRGRVPLHHGAGPGLTNRTMGERAGTETVTLNANSMPTHTHEATLEGSTQKPAQGDDGTPTNKVLARGNQYFDGNSDTDMGATSITNADTGGGQAHANMQPFLSINFCIALTGVFPSR
jgi:microcystin-dependent protein